MKLESISRSVLHQVDYILDRPREVIWRKAERERYHDVLKRSIKELRNPNLPDGTIFNYYWYLQSFVYHSLDTRDIDYSQQKAVRLVEYPDEVKLLLSKSAHPPVNDDEILNQSDIQVYPAINSVLEMHWLGEYRAPRIFGKYFDRKQNVVNGEYLLYEPQGQNIDLIDPTVPDYKVELTIGSFDERRYGL